MPFVEKESTQSFPFLGTRADNGKTLEIIFHVQVYQVIFHGKGISAVLQKLEKLGIGRFIHFVEIFPLRCITGIEILQRGLCMAKILMNICIQFFGADNQIVQLFVIHVVGCPLQFLVVDVLQVFEPNTLCSLVHGHGR